MTNSGCKAAQVWLEGSGAAIIKRLNRVYAKHDLTAEEKAFAQAAARAGFERITW